MTISTQPGRMRRSERRVRAHARLHPAPPCRHRPGDADRRGARVPDAPAHAGRPGRDHRGRQREFRAGRAIRNRLGLDEPIFTQFFIWLVNILRGDFGKSFFFKKTVAELIASRLEPTLALSLATITIAVCVAVPLGVLAAYKQGTLIDKIVMGFSVLGFSVPVFVIGYSLIYLFAIKLNWLPVQGYQRIGDGFGGFLQRLILPARDAFGDLYRADRTHDAHQRARRDGRGLHPHRARQGAGRDQGAVQARAQERRRADRHGDRPRRRAADRRRGRHRERVHHSRPRPAHRRCGAGARLSDHPGGDPVVLASSTC